MYLTNIIKPTHICNLACKYCYNEDTRAPIMTHETLQRVVSETFAYLKPYPKPSVAAFIWHGGEPMVAKLPFYQQVVALQKQYNEGIHYENTIQTNGILINEDWIEFMLENKFRVSISIDGPKLMHDANRIYHNGKGSYDDVMKKINMVKKSGLPLGVCVVINQENKDKVDELYDFLVSEQLHFNIIPMTRGGDAINSYKDIGLEAAEYAEPWIKMFDKWYYANEDHYVYCSDFGAKASAILSGKPTDCIGQEYCARNNISIDPDGYVYPCATLSANDEWNYGNINDQTLAELMQSKPAEIVKNREEDPHCVECKWRHVCHGGCLSRATKFYGTVNTRDYYCPSLYEIYDHIEKRLHEQQLLNKKNLPETDLINHRSTPAERKIIAKTFHRPSPREVKIAINQLKTSK